MTKHVYDVRRSTKPVESFYRYANFFGNNNLFGDTLPPHVDMRSMCSPVVNQGALGSCFHPDTKIPLLDGTVKTIRELYENGKEFWVYSIDENGRIMPGKATSNLTGIQKEVIKLTLDNGEEIICTPEHQFMLRDGSYKKAKDLQTTDSLMPLYRKLNKKGYELVFSMHDNKYHPTYALGAYHTNTNTEISTPSKVLKWGKEILEQYGEINEDNWNKRKLKGGNVVKFDTALKYYNNVDELTEKSSCYNHKIKSIEYLSEKTNVYCLTVEKFHNFALESGVFVHNCTGNAIASGLREFLEVKSGKFTPRDVLRLSRLFVYYEERLREGTVNSDSGAQISDGMKVILTMGIAPESEDPYDASLFREPPSKKALHDAFNWRVSSIQNLKNLDEIRHCLASGYPVVTGFVVFSSFEDAEVASNGIMQMPKAGEQNIGGHAVCIVGYDNNKKWLIVRNSWGADWGDAGYFYMPYEYFNKYAWDFWTARV